MSRHRLLALLLVLALPLVLVACGGDDGNDEDEITEVIETSVTSTDPADCTELATREFVEQTTFEVGDAAIAQCEEDAGNTADNPDSVEVSEISVDGDNATADVAFTGGPLDGSVVSVALVNEDDRWKLNEITDIPEFNFESFQAAFTEQLQGEAAIPPQVADCISQAFADAGEEQVKEVFLSGEGDQLNAIFAECVTG